MMRPDVKVESLSVPVPKPVDFRKSFDGLAALVELDIKVAACSTRCCSSSQPCAQSGEKNSVLGAQRLLFCGSSVWRLSDKNRAGRSRRGDYACS